MVISGYDIKSEIFRGPVTTVFDATHLALGRRVILKVLNTQWIREEDLVDRLGREAKICARLDHPNIVKIFDFNRSDDSVYISMEYIDGSTLEDLTHQKKNISFAELLNFTVQILTGLSFAHNRGIVHRDIKPSNIMISPDGKVKITDFGLAVVSDLPGITSEDQTVGSPAYMSPEQVMGKELDHRSDLFSLGASLYKVSTGKSPFSAETIGAAIQNILTKDIEAISELNNDIPGWYSEIINSFLAKNPDDRPQSAEIILDKIQSIVKDNDIYNEPDLKYSVHHEMTPTDFTPLSVSSNKKIRKRMFLWITPFILILVYMIFSQSSEGITEQAKYDPNPVILPDTAKVETAFLRGSEDTSITEYAIKERKETNIKNPPVVLNDQSDQLQPVPATSSPIPTVNKSHLYIIAKPWAEVYIDSVYYEDTPLDKPIPLEPGKHFIELKNPNYQRFSKKYFLQPALTETLTVDLVLNVGFINIRVLPWAKIYIDGEYLETSPIEKPITIAAGQHILTLMNPNYSTIRDTLEVIPGMTVNKKFNFRK